jgi:Protein of unknown function (DUF2846)
MNHCFAALFVGLSLLGCASVPVEDAQRDAALKTFSIAPDQAGIFIYLNEFIGTAVKMEVWLDGVPLGQTMTKTYLYKSVAPGKHTITSIAENTDTLEVDIRAGSLAFIWQEPRMGFFRARTKLHLMNEAEGRAGVLSCRLAQSMALLQTIQVRVEADDPAWGGPLACQASNSFGSWQFVAPGDVTVEPSMSPLHIRCQVAADAVAASATAPSVPQAPAENARKGSTLGAQLGAGAGLALGVAAAPVMGPAFAVLLGLGSTLRGAELGGMVGAMTAGQGLVYPNPIAVHIQRQSSAD